MTRAGPRLANDPLDGRDDLVAAFQLEGRPVRGRVARLGPLIDEILSAHAYPEPVARLLGETLLLAVLVGDSLKIDGRLIIQAQGDGPAPLVIADYDTGGEVRGYAKVVPERLSQLLERDRRPGASALLGAGDFAMTIDRGPDFERYQSRAPIEGASLAEVAQTYFERSEQVPTRIRLSVAQSVDRDGARWRAGGVLLQQIAGDEFRGDTDEAWETARTLLETVGDDELADPDLSAGGMLYRLFHEEGVRIFTPLDLAKRCTCSHARIARIMASFPREDMAEMGEEDGRVRVTCEFCNRAFALTQAEIAESGGEASETD